MPKRVHISRAVRGASLSFIDDEAIESGSNNESVDSDINSEDSSNDESLDSDNNSEESSNNEAIESESGVDNDSEVSSSSNENSDISSKADKGDIGKGEAMSDQDSCHIYYGSSDHERMITDRTDTARPISTKRALEDSDGDNLDEPKMKKKRYQLSDTDSDISSTCSQKDTNNIQVAFSMERKQDNVKQNNELTEGNNDASTVLDSDDGVESMTKNIKVSIGPRGPPRLYAATTSLESTIFDSAHDPEKNVGMGQPVVRVSNPYLTVPSNQKENTKEDDASNQKHEDLGRLEAESVNSENWDDPNEELSDELLHKMKLAEAAFEQRKKSANQGECYNEICFSPLNENIKLCFIPIFLLYLPQGSSVPH